jgi:hypothetical protein
MAVLYKNSKLASFDGLECLIFGVGYTSATMIENTAWRVHQAEEI